MNVVAVEATAHEQTAAGQQSAGEAKKTVQTAARAGALITLAVGLLIAMGELSRLSGQAVDDQGRVWAFNTLMGPWYSLAGLANIPAAAEPWSAQPEGPFAAAVDTWLLLYLLLDVVFIGLYAALGIHLVFGRTRWACTGRALIVLAVIDLTEDALAGINGRPTRPGVPFWTDRAVVVASAAKWISVAAVIITVLSVVSRSTLDQAAMGKTRAAGAAVRKAIYTQRFSFVFVVPAALLSLIPGADILDQLPDVERAWAQPGRSSEAWWAVAVASVAAASLFVLGRLRSDHLHRWIDPGQPLGPGGEDPRERSSLHRWALAPAPFLVAGLAGQLLGWGSVDWVRLALFTAVALAIAAASCAIRVLKDDLRCASWLPNLRARPKETIPEQFFTTAVLTGDVAAISVLAVAGLGMVRSFTAPVALGALEPLESWVPVVVLLAAGASAVLIWPLWWSIVVTIGSTKNDAKRNWLARLLTPGEEVTLPSWYKPAAVPVVLVALLLVFANSPQAFGALGVVATLLLLLLLVTLTLGSLTVLAQDRTPPELFWIPVFGRKVRSAPVFTMLLAVLLLTSLQGSAADIHGVRGTGATAVAALPHRPTLRDAFDAWEQATAGCGRLWLAGHRQFRVRVMPMLAAEGGGIRAAYWTSAGVDLLSGRSRVKQSITGERVIEDGEKPDSCHGAFFSGGASGGAVGLTVSRFAQDLPAHEQVIAMADSSALGRAALGLVVRDVLHPLTGIPLASGGSPGWTDRAGLIEDAWMAEWKPDGAVTMDTTGALSSDFLPEDGTTAALTPPGFLVLNSTSVSTGCRMFVSQIMLPAPTSARTGAVECDRATAWLEDRSMAGETAAISDSLDFFGFFDGPGDRGCTGNLRAATAAMLAARFPYVTPSGVVGPCSVNSDQSDQLIDGGYVENSGVGTIVDLAPSWLQMVREHNDRALAAGDAKGPIDLVVPMVVYFDNDTSGSLAVTQPGTTLEAFVPPVGFLRAMRSLNTPAALLQRAQSVVANESLWSSGASAAAAAGDAVNILRPRGVIVVNQSMAPAVTAPLGWSMSSQSVHSMNSALLRQATGHCAPFVHDTGTASPPENKGVVCARGYGSLADALETFGSR